MASMVISDAVIDTARFPYTMLAGNAHQTSSTASEPVYRSSASTHSQPATPQLHHPASQSAPGSRDTPDLFPPPNRPPYPAQHAPTTHPTSAPSSCTNASTPADETIPARQQFPSQQYPARPSHDTQVLRQPMQGYDPPGYSHTSTPRGVAPSPASPRLQPSYRSSLSLAGSGFTSPSRIKVRDINHIQSFASEEFLTQTRQGDRSSTRGPRDVGQQYEISAMPVTDIIEMVAGILTKITTTNDRQHEHLHRHIPPPEGTTGLSQQTTSVLAFHGKNVPSITILSYLSRIHKYCPTTYEVFLSLLVYFDRMAEMVNNGSLQSLRETYRLSGKPKRPQSGSQSAAGSMSSEVFGVLPGDAEKTRPLVATPPSSGSLKVQDQQSTPLSQLAPPGPPLQADPLNLSHFFVVDSFNIHRLVIAGVTCASKFFSDVFYTNSRYAKV